MNTKTKIPVRRSSLGRVFILPIQIEHRSSVQPLEFERIADETIQLLVGKMADAQSECDELLAAAIRMVTALDIIDRADAFDGGSRLVDEQLIAMNQERDAAHKALRDAITN